MNYLGHYLAEPDIASPWEVLGLILPDSPGGRVKTWIHYWSGYEGGDPIQVQIASGLQKHIAADAWFHNCAFFLKHSHALREKLEDELPRRRDVKLFFVAHVAVELLIDQYVVREKRAKADGFYAALQAIKGEALGMQWAPANWEARETWTRFYKRFTEEQFLYKLEEEEGIMIPITQLMRHARQGEWQEEEQNIALKIVQEYYTLMFSDLVAFAQDAEQKKR